MEDYKKQKELIELKHKYKMEELAYERENDKLSHDLQLEVVRIKSAEIRRGLERKRFGHSLDSGGWKK